MTPVRTMTALVVGSALVAVLTGCGDPSRVLNDDAACPGESCTDDTQARLDAIARLDDVTTVETVARTYGFDRGASRSAEVTAAVDSPAAAREVALAVLTELDDWPDQPAGGALVVVRAEEGSPPVRQSWTDAQPLSPDFYDPCTPARCDAAVADLERLLTSQVDGLTDVSAGVDGDTLTVTATSDGVPAGRAATAVLDRVEADLEARVAARVEVRIDFREPLEITLRLDEGLVCEQPPGQLVACEPDNSEPLVG